MRLDQLYVRYRSLWLDIDVIFWTGILLIIKAYSPPEPLLFVGPISRLTQRYINWFLWDFLIVFVSIAVTGTVVRLFGPLDIGWFRAVQMALGFSTLYAFIGIALRTDRVNWPKATAWDAVRLGAGWLIVTTLILSGHFYLGLMHLRVLGTIFVAAVLSLSGIIFVRYRKRLIDGFLSRLLSYRLELPATRERVIIVGSGRTAEHLAWLMDHPTYSDKFQVVGFIDDDLRAHGMRIYGSKVIGRIGDVSRIVQEQDVGLIILADLQTAEQQYNKFRELAKFKPARVVVAPDIFGSLSGLGSTSRNNGQAFATDLNDFQCQHCLARYAALNHKSEHVPEKTGSD
jgi:FlaA1/EpsC-like NDP-sugar epimerase